MKYTMRALAALSATGLTLTACGAAPVASHKSKSKVSLGSYSVKSTWSSVGPTPHFSAVDLKLHKVFVSNLAAGTLTVLNSKTGSKITSIKIGGVLHTVMVDAKTNMVYVTDIKGGYLDVVNAKTDSVTARIKVGSHLHGLALAPSLHQAYVTDISTSKVYIINTKTDAIMTPSGITVGPNPWGVVANPKTHEIYVANTGMNLFPKSINPAGNSVSVVNVKTMKVTNTITVGPHPWNLVFDSKNSNLYVGVAGANEVSVINNNKVVGTIPVGKSPHGMTLDKKENALFVNNSSSNTVSVVDTATSAVAKTVAVGTQPQGISVNPKNGFVYVVNQGSQSVSVLAP